MDKSTYLQLSRVQDFIDWLSNRLDTPDLAHRYLNRSTRIDWHCDSLFDAFSKYSWPTENGSDFGGNANHLISLQNRLEAALKSNNDSGCCEAAIDVMKWGGVVPGNVRWLGANQVGLVQLLKNTQCALNIGDYDAAPLNDESLRFNSGMTKVYSLLCDNFVIYDSRVAAALGWIVVCFLKGKGPVPPGLKFPWAPAKEIKGQRNPKRRNPSEGNLLFPRLQAGRNHAEWNLKASWLLEEVLAKSKSNFNNQKNPLRALEAALFMIGYDLPQSSNSNVLAIFFPDDEDAVEDAQWNSCVTLARKKPFRYRITSQDIQVEDGPKFDDKVVNDVLLQLWKDFEFSAFPLSNSATEVRSDGAKNGLGAIYFGLTGRNPPDTSKLAAILEDLTVITPVSLGRQKNLQWTLNGSALDLHKGSKEINIRRLFEKAQKD